MALSEITEIFNELLYGAGGWLTLIVIVAMLLLVGTRTKPLAVVCIPISIFVGISYLQNVDPGNNLMWASIILFLVPFFLGFRLAKDDTF